MNTIDARTEWKRIEEIGDKIGSLEFEIELANIRLSRRIRRIRLRKRFRGT